MFKYTDSDDTESVISKTDSLIIRSGEKIQDNRSVQEMSNYITDLLSETTEESIQEDIDKYLGQQPEVVKAWAQAVEVALDRILTETKEDCSYAGLDENQKINMLWRGMALCLVSFPDCPTLLAGIAHYNLESYIRSMSSNSSKDEPTAAEVLSWKILAKQELGVNDAKTKQTMGERMINLSNEQRTLEASVLFFTESYNKGYPKSPQATREHRDEFKTKQQLCIQIVSEATAEELLNTKFEHWNDNFDSIKEFKKISKSIQTQDNRDIMCLMQKCMSDIEEHTAKRERQNKVKEELVNLQERSQQKENISSLNAVLLNLMNKVSSGIRDVAKQLKLNHIDVKLQGTVTINHHEVSVHDTNNKFACIYMVLKELGASVNSDALLYYMTTMNNNQSSQAELIKDPLQGMKRMNILKIVHDKLGMKQILDHEDTYWSLQLIVQHDPDSQLYQLLLNKFRKIHKLIQDYKSVSSFNDDSTTANKSRKMAKDLQLLQEGIQTSNLEDNSKMDMFIELQRFLTSNMKQQKATTSQPSTSKDKPKIGNQMRNRTHQEYSRARELYLNKLMSEPLTHELKGHDSIKNITFEDKYLTLDKKNIYTATSEKCHQCFIKKDGVAHVPACKENKCNKCFCFGHFPMNCQHKGGVDGKRAKE